MPGGGRGEVACQEGKDEWEEQGSSERAPLQTPLQTAQCRESRCESPAPTVSLPGSPQRQAEPAGGQAVLSVLRPQRLRLTLQRAHAWNCFQGTANQGSEDILRAERELPGSHQFVNHSSEEAGLQRGEKATCACLRAVIVRRKVDSCGPNLRKIPWQRRGATAKQALCVGSEFPVAGSEFPDAGEASMGSVEVRSGFE